MEIPIGDFRENEWHRTLVNGTDSFMDSDGSKCSSTHSLMSLLDNMLKLTSRLLVLNKKYRSLLTSKTKTKELIQTLFHILLILKWMHSLDDMAYILRSFFFYSKDSWKLQAQIVFYTVDT